MALSFGFSNWFEGKNMYQFHKVKSNIILLSSLFILFIISAPIVMAAGPTAPNPSAYTSSSISIPGATSQWTSHDYFSNLYEAFNSGHAQDGTAWLLYNSNTQTVYVLVLANSPSWIGLKLTDDAWVRIDGDTGNTKVTFTSFAWVNEGYKGAGTAEGYMASFTVAPGTHTIRIHMDMYATSDESKEPATAGTPGHDFPLLLTTPPTNQVPETPVFGVIIAIIAGAGLFAASKLNKTKHNLAIPIKL
jgi:hypothetical protein